MTDASDHLRDFFYPELGGGRSCAGCGAIPGRSHAPIGHAPLVPCPIEQLEAMLAEAAQLRAVLVQVDNTISAVRRGAPQARNEIHVADDSEHDPAERFQDGVTKQQTRLAGIKALVARKEALFNIPSPDVDWLISEVERLDEFREGFQRLRPVLDHAKRRRLVPDEALTWCQIAESLVIRVERELGPIKESE